MGTVSSAYLKAIFEGCVQAGAAPDALLALIKGGKRALNNPANRFVNAVLIDILNHAAELTQDQSIGLKVGLKLRPSTFMDVGYALTFCENLADVIATNQKYQALTQQIGTTQLVMQGASAWVEWTPYYGDAERHRYFVENAFAAYATIGRWLLWGKDNPILSVHFRHATPQDKALHETIFTKNIVFEAPKDRIEFISHVTHVPMPNRNPEMMTFLREKLDAQLATLDKPVNIATEVLRCLQQTLPEGRPSISDVAMILGMSERTLRRKLSAESESFRHILEQARKESCEVYMRRGEHNHAEIAQLLGYSDQSAYSRAFRKWFGVSPESYRSKILGLKSERPDARPAIRPF